jgi:hypothetical protein
MILQKPWYQSKTVWGGFITVLAIIAGQFGILIDGNIQQQLIDLFLNGAALLGSALAIYGRLKAVTKLSL